MQATAQTFNILTVLTVLTVVSMGRTVSDYDLMDGMVISDEEGELYAITSDETVYG